MTVKLTFARAEFHAYARVNGVVVGHVRRIETRQASGMRTEITAWCSECSEDVTPSGDVAQKPHSFATTQAGADACEAHAFKCPQMIAYLASMNRTVAA